MMRKLTLLLGCVIHFYALSAQNIHGRITDEREQPLAYANIVLLAPTDSAFVQGTISEEDGSFRMALPDERVYIIKVSSIGYKTLFHRGTGKIGTLALEPDIRMLSEVEIKGTLPAYLLKGDRLTTQVQGSLLDKLGTANEVLARIPGVEGKDGRFTVFGKGSPLIYVNGRKIYDVSELEKINSEDIRSVELIRNPGAEYDASVKAVLNIRLIRKQGDGFGLNVNSQWTQAHRGSHYQQLNLNFRHDRLEVFTLLSFQQSRSWQEQTNDQTIQSDTIWNIFNQLHLASTYNSLYSSTGMNYELNDKHSLGLRYTGNFGLEGKGGWIADMDITANHIYYDRVHNIYTEYYKPGSRHALNAYYIGSIGKLKVDLNLDYIGNRNRRQQESLEWSQAGNDRTVTSFYAQENQLYASKLTGSLPLGKGTLQSGLEISHTSHEDSYANREHILPDADNLLQEDHAAAFVSFQTTIRDWQLNAGLRYEHIKNAYYINRIYNDTQSRVYNNLFPNLSVSKVFNQLQTSISYTARTARPSYNSLSNNRQYNDRFTYQGGNPALRPTTIHDLELNLSYRWILLTASYQYRKNTICMTIEPYEDDPNVCIWMPRNIKRKQELLIMLNLSPQFGCWHPSFTTSVIREYMRRQSSNPAQKPYRPRFYIGLNNLFNLPHQFVVNIDGMCKTQTYENKTWRPGFASLHIGVSKSFLRNEALTVQLRAFDLFKAYRNSAKDYTDTITFESWNYSDSRSLTLTVRYKFNTINSKYKGTGAGNNEKSRL